MMAMIEEQAKRLGALVRAAREGRGLAYSDVAELTGIGRTWLVYLEAGRSLEPSPDRLARLVEVLQIDPAEVDAVSGHYLARSLPSVRTYFRSKGQASTAELDEIERVVAEIHARYGTPLEDDRDDRDADAWTAGGEQS
jgi:transcriptional regulator with XRE-family HTH domain